MPSLAQLIVWIVVGLIGGGLASRLITWDREGFGTLRNLGLGLAGALIGGFLFRSFNLFPRQGFGITAGHPCGCRRIADTACGDLAISALREVNRLRGSLVVTGLRAKGK